MQRCWSQSGRLGGINAWAPTGRLRCSTDRICRSFVRHLGALDARFIARAERPAARHSCVLFFAMQLTSFTTDSLKWQSMATKGPSPPPRMAHAAAIMRDKVGNVVEV